MNELSIYIKHLLKEDPYFQNPADLEPIEKRVAYHVKRIRKERNYTQFELAEMMGVKQPFIARIESGRNNLSIKKLEKLAEVLRIDPVHILRPIYEEGRPERVARIILNRQYRIMAINTGGEALLRERREQLIGKVIAAGHPLRAWMERLLNGSSRREELYPPDAERNKAGLSKAYIRIIKGKMEKILGTEFTGTLQNVT